MLMLDYIITFVENQFWKQIPDIRINAYKYGK